MPGGRVGRLRDHHPAHGLQLTSTGRDVLRPWVNGRKLNIFTSAVIAVLVMLSVVLTAAVVVPDISSAAILTILGVGLWRRHR